MHGLSTVNIDGMYHSHGWNIGKFHVYRIPGYEIPGVGIPEYEIPNIHPVMVGYSSWVALGHRSQQI